MIIDAFTSLYGDETTLFEYYTDNVPRKGEYLSIMNTEGEADLYRITDVLRALSVAPSLSALREDRIAVTVKEVIDL